MKKGPPLRNFAHRIINICAIVLRFCLCISEMMETLFFKSAIFKVFYTFLSIFSVYTTILIVPGSPVYIVKVVLVMINCV